MSKLVMLVGAVAAALGLAVAGPPSERGLSPHPAEARSLPPVNVNVACKATPETTRVKNNRNKAITIRAVGSIYRPFGYEPVRVERKLGAGKTVAFESGAGADRNVLTGSFIYNNEVVGSREGARIRTSVGTFIDKC
jgi:hypothetical protein